jgi:hypothetical protein
MASRSERSGHDFDKTFAILRRVLQPYEEALLVQADEPGNYQLASPQQVDRIGRPLFVAAVQVKKNYVSFHLMPVYACPDLVEELSPALKKRMQGKSCFNFTKINPAHARELAALTRKGIARFKTVELPWSN